MRKRKAWQYGFRQFMWTSPLCCACCCHRYTVKDRLFEDGRKKLHHEIDLLRIIKQLRITAFGSQIGLKPHQVALIKWFETYTMGEQR